MQVAQLLYTFAGQRLTGEAVFAAKPTSYIIRSSAWSLPGESDVVVAVVGSNREMAHYVRGVQTGAFIPMPIASEYERVPGLLERVQTGA